MHAIRLMGMPDKIIAFDGLPDDLVQGLEMRAPDGMPRHWKDWLGSKKKVTKINPERDPYTGAVRVFNPIVEEGPFFYVVDEMLNHDREKWEAICDYVRRNAPKDFRLKDKIEDMAKPMAPDVRSEMKLEPEEVPVIPLGEALITKSAPPQPVAPQIVSIPLKPEVTEEQKKIQMQNNEYFKTLTPQEIFKMRHDPTCKNKGRAGMYGATCAKCDALKTRRLAAAIS